MSALNFKLHFVILLQTLHFKIFYLKKQILILKFTFICYSGLDPVASKSASSAGQSVKKPHTEPSRPLVKKFISSDVLKKPVKITPRHWSINADIRPEDVTDPTSMAATVAKWKKELEQNTMEEKPSTSSSQQDCEPRLADISRLYFVLREGWVGENLTPGKIIQHVHKAKGKWESRESADKKKKNFYIPEIVEGIL